jgi:hypothetical protein
VEGPAWGAHGQGPLLRDVHCALLRLMEGADEEILEAPTLAGYGSAAALAPQEAYKPLLGVTWPELVRHFLEVHPSPMLGQDAAEALNALRRADYCDLPGSQRLILLEALIHAAADTETVRNYIAEMSPDEEDAPLPRGAPMGVNSSGSLYFHLGSDTGRSQLFVESSGGGEWGFYDLQQIPRLVEWLESGSDAEQDLAEDIYETFEPVMRAQPQQQPGAVATATAVALLPPSTSVDSLGRSDDGYRFAKRQGSAHVQLREQLLQLLNGARFWEKDSDWLQARAAVLVRLRRASESWELARLMWLVEDLIYDDLLKGTGWGRRRGWYREQLENCRTISQVAVIACQLAVHCRPPSDMGILSLQEFQTVVMAQRMQLPFLPAAGSEAVWLRSGYVAHLQRQRPPQEPAPVPASWAAAEKTRVEEVFFSRGHWQRPVWQGRFAGASNPGAEDDSLVVTWFLLEKPHPPAQPSDGDQNTEDEIDWSNFTFQHGFRQLRPRLIEPFGPAGEDDAQGPVITDGIVSPAEDGPVTKMELDNGSKMASSVKPEPQVAPCMCPAAALVATEFFIFAKRTESVQHETGQCMQGLCIEVC